MPVKNYYKYKKRVYKNKKIPKNYFSKNKIRPLLKTQEKDFQKIKNETASIQPLKPVIKSLSNKPTLVVLA